MITILLQGGLGNQLFQYAAGRSLAIKHNTDLLIDTSLCGELTRNLKLNLFNTNAKFKYLNKLHRAVLKHIKPCIKEKSAFHFDSSFIKQPSNTSLNGYFQSDKYFKDNWHVISKELELKHNPRNEIQILANKMQSENSVSIHIRRGDYVNNPIVASFHGTCPETYYLKALDMLKQEVSNLSVYVFSDDPQWAKDNTQFSANTTYIDSDYSKNDIEDFYLMKSCRFHIIANSTFSWWAAYLCTFKEKKVFAPAQWTKNIRLVETDLIVEGWVVVE